MTKIFHVKIRWESSAIPLVILSVNFLSETFWFFIISFSLRSVLGQHFTSSIGSCDFFFLSAKNVIEFLWNVVIVKEGKAISILINCLILMVCVVHFQKRSYNLKYFFLRVSLSFTLEKNHFYLTFFFFNIWLMRVGMGGGLIVDSFSMLYF